MFNIGQDVICIADYNDKWPCRGEEALYPGPKKYQVLKIYNMLEWKYLFGVDWGLMFPEFPNNWYNAHYFRPLRETSIEVFTKLLKVKEDELV